MLQCTARRVLPKANVPLRGHAVQASPWSIYAIGKLAKGNKPLGTHGFEERSPLTIMCDGNSCRRILEMASVIYISDQNETSLSK